MVNEGAVGIANLGHRTQDCKENSISRGLQGRILARSRNMVCRWKRTPRPLWRYRSRTAARNLDRGHARRGSGTRPASWNFVGRSPRLAGDYSRTAASYLGHEEIA